MIYSYEFPWKQYLFLSTSFPRKYKIKSVSPRGNQPWIFIGGIDAEAEVPIFWPFWYKGLTHWKRPWCWEKLKAGGEGGDRGWDGWMASPNVNLSKFGEIVKDREAWCAAVHGATKSWTRPRDWMITMLHRSTSTDMKSSQTVIIYLLKCLSVSQGLTDSSWVQQNSTVQLWVWPARISSVCVFSLGPRIEGNTI